MAPPEVKKSRIDVGVVAVMGLGLLIGYMACLYGSGISPNTLVAFAVWSVAAIFVGLMILLFYKVALMGGVLFVAFLWWTDNAAFRGAAADLRGLRGDLCGLIKMESEGLPVKEWIC